MTTLLLSSRHTPDDQALWRAAIHRGWATERARGIQLPEIADPEIVIYVEALFAQTLAERVGRQLLDPSEDWLAKLPAEFRKRDVELTTLAQARSITTPTFVKPPNDKLFKAQVFASGRELPEDYDATTPVLVAEPVAWESEYRCFCLDGDVITASPYWLAGAHAATIDFEAPPGEVQAARELATEVLAATGTTTPRAIVIDVGIMTDRGWGVVEANGAWGSGIYGCDPGGVLDVIRCATVVAAS